VLLRVAIGWHFGYEGLWKIESWRRGNTPFSAEGYLRNASGPLAPYFRAMVPDVDGLAKLDQDRLEDAWKNEVTRIGDHYGFNDVQRQQAKTLLADGQKWAGDWFSNRENREKIQKYRHDIAAVEQVERNPRALANERDWAAAERHALDADRKNLTKELDARATALRDAVVKLATTEQTDVSGASRPALTMLDLNNYMTAGSLVAIGFCLIAGLFTRPAALGGVGFLTLIYLCMPPWPGLPPNPLAEGHFLYVDKNLVEIIALLALAALPTGHWIGLDALLFGWWRRRREARREARAVEAEPVSRSGRKAHSVS
jgi:uncharacterized membrane protein YphA (DoxX/SURF4 family)